MPTLYTLSYKPSSQVTAMLTFNTETNQLKHKKDVASTSTFFCISRSSDVSWSLGTKLAFTNKEQENQFKQALANQDVRTALSIAQDIEKLNSDTEPHPQHQPVRYFLEGYIAQQQKNSVFNKGFFVSQGVCKRREVQFSSQEVDMASAGMEPG